MRRFRQKASLEKKLEIPMDAPDYMKIIDRLKELEGVKKELSSELSVTVKADAEAAKTALKDVNREIADVSRKIVIETDAQGINEAAAELKLSERFRCVLSFAIETLRL